MLFQQQTLPSNDFVKEKHNIAAIEGLAKFLSSRTIASMVVSKKLGLMMEITTHSLVSSLIDVISSSLTLLLAHLPADL